MGMTIKISGLKNISKMLENVKSNIKENVKTATNESAELLKENIQSSIRGEQSEPRSVKSGALLNSVESIITDDSFSVSSDLPYAGIIEKGSSKFEGRHHWENSKNRKEKEIIKEKFILKINNITIIICPKITPVHLEQIGNCFPLK